MAEELEIDVTDLFQDHIAIPNNLPSSLTSFVGRKHELIEIKDLLDSNRLLTLTGAAGCGKSRLALEIGRDLIPDYADGVWLVELAPLTIPAQVPQAVAMALGVREEHRRPLTEVLLGHLKRKQTLLILDNCEHLLPACAELVGSLIPACPHLQLLATSREIMNISGETTYLVPPLQMPDVSRHICLEELRNVESVRLLVERAAARSDFALSESNALSVIEICRHLDGIPLALELAAAQVRTISVNEIAERLDDRFQLLTNGHRATLSKHRTLRALIDWSYDLLSDDEQLLFRRLSVFAGGWSLHSAESVCTGDHIEKSDVLDLLAHLVDKSLVEVDSDEEQGMGRSRYRFLETVRHYARERLMENGEHGAVCRRHRAFFLALAEEAEPNLDGPDQRLWLTRLEDEHDNLRAALRACSAGDDAESEVGFRLAGALGLFWEVCGYWSEGRAMCAELLAGSTRASGRSSIRAKALKTTGKLALLLGDTTQARSLLEESLAINRHVAHKRGIACSLNELGILASNQGDFAAARSFHEESLAITRELGDRCGVAKSLMNLGVVARRQGDYAAARSFHEESLAMMRELGDRRRIAMVLANLGNVAYGQCDFAEAHSLYAECLGIFRELGDKPDVANTLNNLGNVARRQHDHATARSLYEDGLAIAKELGDKRGSGRALRNLGNIAFQEGDYARARVLYEESLAIHRDLGDKQEIADLLHNLAIVSRHQGLHAESRALSEECLVILRELGDEQGVAESLGNLGLVAWSEGDYARARTLCEQSLAICRKQGELDGIAERLITLGCVANHERRADRAIRLFASGHGVAKRNGCRLDPSTLKLSEKSVSALRARVDDETFAREWSLGQAMGLDQAIQYALGEKPGFGPGARHVKP